MYKILFNRVNNAVAVKNNGTFKMKIETAVIHVDGTDNGYIVIGYHIFAMDKTGGIFVYFDACLQKRQIITSGAGM